ncbi:MAG TPA: metal ABC transporter permease [Ktedonosporobacter sp.]|jgi:zinc/manganese transport system permease protein|nr:metal ABC transporter permease [Ktedonosporobacter sp.]
MFTLLQYPFIQNALLAGSLVAIIAAIIGYFLIMRGLTFAGHALSHIGFAGAAGAVLLGTDPVFGLLVFTVGAGVGIGLLGKELRERDIVIGVITTLTLALGILFLSLYRGYAEQAYSILFGTIIGISQTDVLITMLFSIGVLALLLVLFRPLLFSSFDPEVAQARGVPVKSLAIIFLVLVAITVSMSVQVVGILLIFTLLVGPAATATRLAQRPLIAILLAIVLGLAYTWLGILLAATTSWPVSFFIAALSFGVYLLVRLLTPLRKVRTPGRIEPYRHHTLASPVDPAQPRRAEMTGPRQNLSH